MGKKKGGGRLVLNSHAFMCEPDQDGEFKFQQPITMKPGKGNLEVEIKAGGFVIASHAIRLAE